MIKDALEWFLGLGQATEKNIEGRIYSDKELFQISKDPTPEPLKIRNLTGLVDYVTYNYDHQPPVMIHVVSATQVTVMTSFNRNMHRNVLVEAIALLPKIQFDSFQDVESFNILLQSCFVLNEHRSVVLKVTGNIADENTMTLSDDGVTQRVTAKVGIADLGFATVPNPVELVPYRTFVEIDQPESEFVLRIKKTDRGPVAGIFEADGGAWKLEAVLRIKKYLDDALAEQIKEGRVTIIA